MRIIRFGLVIFNNFFYEDIIVLDYFKVESEVFLGLRVVFSGLWILGFGRVFWDIFFL